MKNIIDQLSPIHAPTEDKKTKTKPQNHKETKTNEAIQLI